MFGSSGENYLGVLKDSFKFEFNDGFHRWEKFRDRIRGQGRGWGAWQPTPHSFGA